MIKINEILDGKVLAKQRKGVSKELDVKVKKSIIQIPDALKDISQKLDYIIKKQTENFLSIAVPYSASRLHRGARRSSTKCKK